MFATALETLAQDVRFAWRQWRKRPLPTLVALVVLTLGIGANTGIFSVAHGVLLRPLPYAEPENLVRMWPETTLSPKMLEAIQNEIRGFAGITGFSASSRSLADAGSEPTTTTVATVSAQHFDVLGVRPALGRGFTADDAVLGSPPVVVLGSALWRSRYGADPEILGQTILLDDQMHSVVGVMSDTHRPLRSGWQLWTPQVLDRESTDFCCSRHLDMVGRLASGVTPAVAISDLRRVAADLQAADPRHLSDRSVETASVSALHDDLVSGSRSRLVLLLAAVAVVLLAACANIANLQLAQIRGRRRELAVRAALGAGRGRLVRQLAVESLLLAGVGGGAGVAAAALSLDGLLKVLPADLPGTASIGLAPGVLGFAALASIGAALAFGLVPAWQVSRQTLSEGGRGAAAGRHGWSKTLVAAQVAASVVLLLGAGLLGRSLWNLLQVDPGFRTDDVATVRISPSPTRHAEAEQRRALTNLLLERLEALPSVKSLAATQSLPLGPEDEAWIFPFLPPGEVAGDQLPITRASMVSDDFFSTLEVPIVAGRSFDREPPDELRSVIVNQAFARRHFGAEGPALAQVLGRRVQLFNDRGPALDVVGVAGDVRQTRLESDGGPEIYLSLAQWPMRELSLVIGHSGDLAALSSVISPLVRTLDDRAVVGPVRPLADLVAGAASSPRSLAWLVGAFALQALLLGAAGVYGVTSTLVAERRAEMAVRLALGARRADVERLVVRSGLFSAAAGAAAGVVLASAFGRLAEGLLYGVATHDPIMHLGAVVVVVLAALLASWLPARRAGAVEPASVLRAE